MGECGTVSGATDGTAGVAARREADPLFEDFAEWLKSNSSGI